MVAAAALIWIPDISPLAIAGLGAGNLDLLWALAGIGAGALAQGWLSHRPRADSRRPDQDCH